METHTLRSINVTRYVTPLREGGSMPAIVEGDDNFLYALKFKGAGQGKRALIAELIGGEIARAIGLRIPEIVFANLDEAFGRMEGDEEIQDLLKASTGLNLALHYLSGAISFDAAIHSADAAMASKVVLLDSLLLNVDRTARNTNMLWWNKELWLIDHGAALYFHHNWQNWETKTSVDFIQIKDHVLLRYATALEDAAGIFRKQLTAEQIKTIVDLIPEEWLADERFFNTVEEHRAAYTRFLTERLTHLDNLVKNANHAR
jgi:hypothetical protein